LGAAVTTGDIVGLVSVFFAGLLAGEEFIVRFGVRGPLAELDDRPHILMRQGLIRTLRVLVPCLFFAALTTAVASTVIDGIDSAFALRCVGIGALLCWIAVTLGGTVPINAAALEWDASNPPENWRTQVDRWERLNTVRAGMAVIAFGFLLVGLTLTATRT
jgi:uncharacterized membrane protein